MWSSYITYVQIVISNTYSNCNKFFVTLEFVANFFQLIQCNWYSHSKNNAPKVSGNLGFSSACVSQSCNGTNFHQILHNCKAMNTRFLLLFSESYNDAHINMFLHQHHLKAFGIFSDEMWLNLDKTFWIAKKQLNWVTFYIFHYCKQCLQPIILVFKIVDIKVEWVVSVVSEKVLQSTRCYNYKQRVLFSSFWKNDKQIKK